MIVQDRRRGLRDVVAHIVGGAAKDSPRSDDGGGSDGAEDPLEHDLIAYMQAASEAERSSLMQLIKLCISDKQSRERALEAIGSGAATASAILALVTSIER